MGTATHGLCDTLVTRKENGDHVSLMLTHSQVAMMSYCVTFTLGLGSSDEGGSRFLSEDERRVIRELMFMMLAADDQFRGLDQKFEVDEERLTKIRALDGTVPEKEKRRARRAAKRGATS